MDAASATVSFGDTQFGTADFGDQRLTNRLIQSANRVVEHPGCSLPEKMESPAALQGFYRFANNGKVTHAKVLAPHCQVTRERIAARGRPAYVVYDTTELDYSGLDANLDL